jgi:hypothetical protein
LALAARRERSETSLPVAQSRSNLTAPPVTLSANRVSKGRIRADRRKTHAFGERSHSSNGSHE